MDPGEEEEEEEEEEVGTQCPKIHISIKYVCS